MKRSTTLGIGGLVIVGALAIGAFALAQPAAAGPLVTVYKTPT
jgi:hypothetical protein